MPAPIDQTKVLEALRDLGIAPQEFQALRFATHHRAQEMLATLKEKARKAFKKVALELHPDRTQNDPVKTERFKMIGQVVADIDKLNIQPPPPPVHHRRVVMSQERVQFVQVPVSWVQVSRMNTAAASTTSPTSSTVFDPTYVVYMRPAR